MKNLLWVGDAACPSGFARVTHKILETLHKEWNVFVLGINFRGDSDHGFPYPIYAASPGGDSFGIGRFVWACDKVKSKTGTPPDMIVLLNDPWNIPYYIKKIKEVDEYKNIPIVGYIAVDGLNCRGDMLNDLDLAIFWTKFGEREARLGGFTGQSAVVSLGVDRSIYYPTDRIEARKSLGFKQNLDSFIVGNLNRNQPRKRLDLSIAYFFEWISIESIEDAVLLLHIGPTGDTGYDCKQLALYYARKFQVDVNRMVMFEPDVWEGFEEEVLRAEYNAFDVQLTTSQGEGMGLPALEGMSCGTPQIGGDCAAYGEWAKGAMMLIPCDSSITTDNNINSIGGIPNKKETIAALDSLYRDLPMRHHYRSLSIRHASDPKFDWGRIGKQFNALILHITESVERQIVSV